MQRRFVMAIDAGATETRCALADFEGNFVGFSAVPQVAEGATEWEARLASIRAAAATALAGSERDVPTLDVVVVGAAGIGPDGERTDELESLVAEWLPQASRVRVVSDLVSAFWGALSMPVGVVVSAGIGSACFGRNVTGETCHVGGWGSILGDEGSAYDIGRRALRALGRAADGRGRPTGLSLALARQFDVHDTVEMARKFESEPPDRTTIASLLTTVSAAARRNDQVAIQILQGAARDLAIATATALRQLNLLEMPTSVSYSGEVFEAGRPLIEPFTRAVGEATSYAKVEPPLLPPIGGAFRLGLQMLSVTMDDSIVHRFAKGLVSNGW